LRCGVLADGAANKRKNPDPACRREFHAGAAAGVRSNILDITTLSRIPLIREFPDPARVNSAADSGPSAFSSGSPQGQECARARYAGERLGRCVAPGVR